MRYKIQQYMKQHQTSTTFNMQLILIIENQFPFQAICKITKYYRKWKIAPNVVIELTDRQVRN